MVDDEILEAEMREQLIAQGVDEFSLDFILEDMRDSGMFDPEGSNDHEGHEFCDPRLGCVLPEESNDHEGHEFCDPRLGCVLPEGSNDRG